LKLHTDIPSRAQIDRLLASRHPSSVSIYVPTDPASTGDAARIAFEKLAAEAMRQLGELDRPKAELRTLEESLADLAADAGFWRLQARSLGVFAAPEGVTTFRLPNLLVELVEVSDRFHVKPLLRAVTFPQVALVLALAQGSVRVLEVSPDVPPERIDVPDLPTDAPSAVGKASIADRSPSRRLQGSEGQKVRLRQFARQVDQALRPVLGGLGVPLVLAAAEPLDSIYRSVSTYPQLASTTVAGSPETTSDAELVEAARAVLDELYADELRVLRELYERRASEGRAAGDIADIARAATFGAVDTVFVDIDEVVPGTLDEETGAVSFAHGDDAVTYGVADEIARLVWRTCGRVLAVRRDDVPGGESAAAILRYAV
jgi:hypothetical protein